MRGTAGEFARFVLEAVSIVAFGLSVLAVETYHTDRAIWFVLVAIYFKLPFLHILGRRHREIRIGVIRRGKRRETGAEETEG